MTNQSELRNKYPINTFRGTTQDELVDFITANYTPNTKLKALIEASEKLNLEFHGIPDCKNCSLQEQLAELTKGTK